MDVSGGALHAPHAQLKNSHYLNQWYSSGCLHLVFVNIATWNTVNLGIDS